MPTYKGNHPPFAHQAEALRLSWLKPLYALLMEQRTGKTKVILDTVGKRYVERGDIDTLVIVAPNGVHRNWITDECPTHWPASLPWHGLIWRSGATKKWREELGAALTYKDGILVVAFNIEAFRTKLAKAYLRDLLKRRGHRTLLAVDESSIIKTPNAISAKHLRAAGRAAAMRRILEGTPMTESPFEAYGQFAFLSYDILGFTKYSVFKSYFAEFEEGYNHNTGTSYQTIKTDEAGNKLYKNLDVLQKRIAPYSYIKARADCHDMPPKLYQKEYFELSPAQRAQYDSLREEYVMELQGEKIAVPHVLTRWLRLQQITSNFYPPQRDYAQHPDCEGAGCDACDWLGIVQVSTPLRVIDPQCNPRLDAFMRHAQHVQGQGVVWCRFTEDVNEVLKALEAAGCRSSALGRYDGTVSEKDRAKFKERFQAGKLQWMVGQVVCGGRGLDFSMADFMCFYSNYFSLRMRLQGEDRIQNMLKKRSSSYLDLVGMDTIDEPIVDMMRGKFKLHSYLMGRKPEQFL